MSRTSRYLTRQYIIQALYQWQMNHDELHVITAQFISQDSLSDKMDQDVFRQRLHAITTQIETLNELIRPYLDRNQYHLGELEWAILLLATYELRFDHLVPNKVAIDQALELAKRFGCDNSKGFINAVLDKINLSLSSVS